MHEDSYLRKQGIRFSNGSSQSGLGIDSIEQRVLDVLEDDRVDIRFVRNGWDDVGVLGTMSPEMGLTLSSMATDGAEKNGSS